MIKTVLLDLFGTLVFFHYSRLPIVEINGKMENTTAGEVYRIYKEYFSHPPFSEFYSVFKEGYKKFLNLKSIKCKEYNSSVRFDILLNLLNISNTRFNKQEIISKMVSAHMKSLSKATSFPDENLAVLKYLKKKGYNLGLVSNFDHAPTARELLDKYGISRYFNTIVISDEIGWRKPHPIVFKTALKNFKGKKVEAVFIGDNYWTDVIGASSVGMQTVWITETATFENNKKPSNLIIIKKLDELISIL